MKEKSVEVARRANYARLEHQRARRLRESAGFGARIVPSDVGFMHVVQKFDATRPGEAAEIAWL
jgi:hypothetical protein